MPFGGLLIAGASSLIPAVMKGFTSRRQRQQAERLRQVDVTPEGQRENLAAARLAASAIRSPGQDVAETRINQSTAATLAAAAQGATGSGSLLATLGRTNGQRLAALGALPSSAAAARERLAAVNTRQDAFDAQSRAEYNNAKTSLTQAADENEMSALSDVANTGAFVGGNLLDSGARSAAAAAAAGGALPVDAGGNLRELTTGEKLLLRRRYGKAPAVNFPRTMYANVA